MDGLFVVYEAGRLRVEVKLDCLRNTVESRRERGFK